MTSHELAQELLSYPDKEIKIQYHDFYRMRISPIRLLNVRNFDSAVLIDVSQELEDID